MNRWKMESIPSERIEAWKAWVLIPGLFRGPKVCNTWKLSFCLGRKRVGWFSRPLLTFFASIGDAVTTNTDAEEE